MGHRAATRIREWVFHQLNLKKNTISVNFKFDDFFQRTWVEISDSYSYSFGLFYLIFYFNWIELSDLLESLSFLCFLICLNLSLVCLNLVACEVGRFLFRTQNIWITEMSFGRYISICKSLHIFERAICASDFQRICFGFVSTSEVSIFWSIVSLRLKAEVFILRFRVA